MLSIIVLGLVIRGAVPRFRAVVQVYRGGVKLIDGGGREIGADFRRYGRGAELATGPESTFAIIANGHVATYDGLRLKSDVRVDERGRVVGWSEGWPVVQEGAALYRISGKSKVAMPAELKNADCIAGSAGVGYLCGLDHIIGDTLYAGYSDYVWSHGQISAVKALGPAAGSMALVGWRILVGTSTLFDEKGAVEHNGALSLFDPKDSSIKALSTDRGASWIVQNPDRSGTVWITASGYQGRERKFFERETVYKYTERGGLQQVLRRSGDFSAFDLDETGRFLLGQRLYGFEMGAYDLVAVDLRTQKEVPILPGVEKFQEI